MKKLIKKIIEIFIIICAYFVGCTNKIYALTTGLLYGIDKPEPKYYIINWTLTLFLILLPISMIITIIIGTIKYIEKSRDSKVVKLLIVIIEIIAIVTLIRLIFF